jgi:hypothetical protein
MINTNKLTNLLYSPEFVARLLHRFISGSQAVNNNGIKYELMYLLLPIIMNDTLRKSLEKASKVSAFDSLILSESNKFEIHYLDEFVENMRDFTNSGLIFLSSYTNVNVGSYLKADELVDFKCEDKILKEFYRAAYYLGLLLSKETHLNVFLKTRVKCI